MPTPASPKLLKGAIVAYRLPETTPTVIVFQYNPATLQRSLEAQAAGEEGAADEAYRLAGAPVETIKAEIELDAADQLETGDAAATENGLLPQLAALELLLYPATATVIANTALALAGTIEIVPASAPFTLFVYGRKRVLPVRITEYSATEEAHDPDLNPIQAKVSLGLRVLSYSDLPRTHPGYHLFLAHQVTKEAMATIARVNALDAVIGDNARIL
ncbi:MAG: hypothetical protein RID91_04840 [Azospirillaceae bacterium]